MKNRNIVVGIILSIVTCGIYAIYWFVKCTDEMNQVSPDDYTTSGIVAFLFTLITCGIYGIYWSYKFYKKADYVVESDNYIICFILQIIGFGIASQAITQSAINSYIERKNNLINL